MRRTLSLVLVTAVTGCRLYGAPFAGPAMPVSEYADTEAVTNFFLSVIRDDVRVFAFSLEFAATPSNNVEVAFGRDADGDGVLGPHE